jgi:hypothetical protein
MSRGWPCGPLDGRRCGKEGVLTCEVDRGEGEAVLEGDCQGEWILEGKEARRAKS